MAVAALRAGALTGLLNQSSAQVIDGSLTFDDDKSQHLKRTFATEIEELGLGVVG